jgi:PQQ-dependent catabolism-associated CXXCW motif protein
LNICLDMRRLALIAFGVALVSAGLAQTPGHVPEPAGLWQGPMHGYTPNTVEGAKVIDTAALANLLADKEPLLLDVALADKKPPSMSPATPWMPAHRSIPGAIWMPGAGGGGLDPKFSDAFRDRLGDLTGGDLAYPIVTFCHPDCWGSWNAAKRLARLGYSRVYWYPEGIEGWQVDHDSATVKADPTWAAADPADQPQ